MKQENKEILYPNEITLEDLQKAAEEVFGKESEFPRKLVDDWWQLSPNFYGNDKAYEDFCKCMKVELNKSEQIKE